jgi:DNA topoisomerase-1
MAAKKKKRNLVIVESPAKARTLTGILGRDYDVRASVGHVRDLPKRRLGVDVENGFAPTYLVPKEKREVVRKLKEAAEGAGAVYLATDPDREGEAISWHVMEAVELDGVPTQRVVFHEITPESVRRAFDEPRQLDMRLVDSQQARRIVDRLVGYKISPILWRKVRRGLSAGRVQSVALRIVVEREREIEGFVPREYWTIDADLAPARDGTSPDEPACRARLVGLAGKKKKLEIDSGDEAERLTALLRKAAYRVADVRRKKQVRRPAPPFITSTLQQEASRRFGFSAKRTMAIAQQLYEGRALGGDGERRVGLITYMRSDSTRVSEQAKSQVRAYIREKYGASFLPRSPRVFQKKVPAAQEAHEAIRPTSVRREPASLRRRLTADQHKLYTLIWQRMVASQMADAVFDNTTVEIEARPASGRDTYLFRATDTILHFAGYRQLYQETTAEEAKSQEPRIDLTPLTPGEELRLLALLPEQHFTEPPPRFTEATLVKALEENGIGRPSTYAPILSTIQDRGYVEREGRALRPTELGYVVNDLLVSHFADIVDVSFTAEMEEELDDIASGEREWQPVVQQFYEPLVEALSEAAKAPVVEEPTDEICEKCGRPMVLRWGRYGRFVACSGFPECQNTKPVEVPVTDERCDLCGAPMAIKGGRYGTFLACTRYPDCKGRRAFVHRVGVACPDCGGDIVERTTKRGRRFYGCSNYPRCRFTSWARPLPGRCPQCGDLVVAAAKSGARCRRCSWRGSPAAAKAAAEAPVPAEAAST